jgi:hypothetical protein
MKALLFFIILGAIATPAFAGPQATRVQKMNFDGTDVDGKVRQPDGSYVTQKRGIEFVPLYKLKENFDEQIQDSVEYIK